jgi:hypothetical protein
MAVTAARRTRPAPEAPPIETQPVAPIQPRKNGRAAKGPAPAGAIPPGVDFWDWLSVFTPDDWPNLIGYLWRTAPLIDRRLSSGRATSIRKYATKFDLERIMLDEGSGGYRLDFCRIEPGTGLQRRIAQHFFEIVNMDYPPRVPLGDWIDDPDNQMWRWAEPALKQREAEADAAGAPLLNATPDPSAMFTTVLQGIRTLRGESNDNTSLAAAVIQMVQTNQTAMLALNDPAKQLHTLQSLLTLITPKEKPGGENNLLIEFFREELKATREELREMRQQKQVPPRSFMEEVKELVPALKELAPLLGLRAAGRASDETDWGNVAITAIDKLSEHVPLFIQAIRDRNGERPPVVAWPLIDNPPKKETTSPGNATAPPGGATTEPSPAASATDEEQRARATAKTILAKYGPLIQAIAPFMVDQYKGGLTGYDFRDWFLSRHGSLNWTGLRDECGAENLVALAQMHPHLKVALAPPERLLVFLKDFFIEPGQEPAEDVQTDDDTKQPQPEAVQ